MIEVAAGGEVDVETRDGQVTVVGKDGSMLEADGNNSKIMLAGKNEAGTLEANCVLSTSKDPEHPGVILMLSWTDRTAVTPG